MKTTEVMVNAECPGCGKECPPKLGIPGGHQHGWEWDTGTEQRWCRRCYKRLWAGRHFNARGWVWKVTRHEMDGDHVRYVDELTDHIQASEAWNRVTVTLIFDPSRTPPEELSIGDYRSMVEELGPEGATYDDMEIYIGEDTQNALRELTNT